MGLKPDRASVAYGLALPALRLGPRAGSEDRAAGAEQRGERGVRCALRDDCWRRRSSVQPAAAEALARFYRPLRPVARPTAAIPLSAIASCNATKLRR